jgi:uncharacterized protein YqgC (DUF456 family)
MSTDTILIVVGILLVILGVVGIVLPGLPGAPAMFGGFLLIAWAEDFQTVGVWTLVSLGILALLTYLVDFAAGAFGAKRFGASKRAIIGAALGTLVGLFFGLPGILLGPFVGAVIGELTSHGDLRRAGKAGIGTTLGMAVGAAFKIGLALTMLGLFILVRFIQA